MWLMDRRTSFGSWDGSRLPTLTGPVAIASQRSRVKPPRLGDVGLTWNGSAKVRDEAERFGPAPGVSHPALMLRAGG